MTSRLERHGKGAKRRGTDSGQRFAIETEKADGGTVSVSILSLVSTVGSRLGEKRFRRFCDSY
jgi:hypothetical protein